MNISENLQRILTDKQNIANAINAKGVSCTVSESLDTYADKIAQIQSGGGGGLPEIHDDDPFTFVQVRPDYTGSIALVNNDTTAPNAKTFEYNKNDIGWQTYNVGDEITMEYADKVQFRSNDTLPICTANYFRKFITNGFFNCGGDLRSLYPGDVINANYCFRRLFENTNILNVPKLPYTQVKNYCYSYMFSGCNLLISLPENLLPATTLASQCYSYMFSACSSLTTLPENLLPATTLAEYCYSNMFNNCSSLTTLPENLLPATTLALNCYNSMFKQCSSLTTLPENLLTATTLANYCYYYMFSACTSLTSLPENLLPATTLASSCYNYMFYNCSSLTNAPKLPATTLESYCYSYMFGGCTSLTTLPENLLPATTLASSCYYYMFYKCSSLTNAPKLPATTLALDCYRFMFCVCSKLKEVYCNARYNADGSEITTNIGYNWLIGAPNTTDCIFYKNKDWSGPTTRGSNTIPSNWQIATYS